MSQFINKNILRIILASLLFYCDMTHQDDLLMIFYQFDQYRDLALAFTISFLITPTIVKKIE